MGVERGIDSRKHRKSSHLASADLDIRQSEGKSLVFTIDDVRYDTSAEVNGKATEGYYIKFKEGVKEWKVNSVNRTVISRLAKARGFNDIECHNIGKWIGIRLELYVDRKVKMMGEIVDGIRVRPLEPKEKVKPNFTEANFEAASKAKATIEIIKKSYNIDAETEKKYLSYGK